MGHRTSAWTAGFAALSGFQLDIGQEVRSRLPSGILETGIFRLFRIASELTNISPGRYIRPSECTASRRLDGVFEDPLERMRFSREKSLDSLPVSVHVRLPVLYRAASDASCRVESNPA